MTTSDVTSLYTMTPKGGRTVASSVNLIPIDYLYIPQGGTFKESWAMDDATTGAPVVWAGWYARMQIRSGYNGTVIADLKSDAGGLVFGSDGNITATMNHVSTAALTPGRDYVWDLELTDPGGATWRAVEGRVAITAEVTKDV